VAAASQELEQAQRERDKAEADLRGYVEAASALDPALFRRGLDARQKRLDDARAKVQAASARTTRLPRGGSLIDLWDGFAPAQRREVIGGFLDRIDVQRGASSDLSSHVRIVWADGEIADDETRVRVLAA
jgi:hypothetical protein